MAQRSWYKYTDESGKPWRIQTSAALAEIGGLLPADSMKLEPLPANIKPRYVWLKEEPRPIDRLAARQKVILEKDHLQNVPGVRFEVAGKNMRMQSYYGEVVSLP